MQRWKVPADHPAFIRHAGDRAVPRAAERESSRPTTSGARP
jgi:hypothetical protein